MIMKPLPIDGDALEQAGMRARLWRFQQQEAGHSEAEIAERFDHTPVGVLFGEEGVTALACEARSKVYTQALAEDLAREIEWADAWRYLGYICLFCSEQRQWLRRHFPESRIGQRHLRFRQEAVRLQALWTADP